MKLGWQTKRLDDVCEVEYGTRVVNKRDGGSIYPVYGGGGPTFFMDKYNREERLVVARFAISEKCTRFVSGKFFLNDSGLTVSPKNGSMLVRFLDYQLLALNDEIYGLAKGSAQKNLDVPAFRNLQLAIVNDKTEQQRIVAILDAAFDDIATARTNTEQNLQNARALFGSYLQSIFTKRGKGWVTQALGNLCEVKDGTHDSPKYVLDGIPFVTQKNVREDGLSFTNTKFISNEDHAKFYKRSNVAYGDILISMIGANRGMACLVDDERVFSIKNVGLVKASDAINQRFLLYFLRSSQAAEYVKSGSKGGAQEFIGLTELRKFPVVFPELNRQVALVAKFDELSTETQRLEVIYQRKLAALDDLKKSLLQQGFSGQL
jgi:type I restriction enzyme, S subunit